MKKVLFLNFFFILCFIELKAQKNCSIEMLDFETNRTETVCFKRDTFPKNEKGEFITKYIFLKNGIEIYEVSFSFNEKKDSSSFEITFLDRQTKSFKIKNMTFKNGSSFFIINDFRPNDTLINNDDLEYTLLFSVPNEDEPYVIINKFRSFDENLRFKVTPIDPIVFAKHIAQTKIYIEIKRDDSVKKVKYYTLVNSFKAKMENYKDSVIKSIDQSEFNIANGFARITPSTTLQDKFKSILNPFFISYFRTLFLFEKSDIDVDIEFLCNGYGKIDTSKIKIINKNGLPITWFVDTFRYVIQPLVDKEMYEVIVESKRHPNLYDVFLNEFQHNMDSLRTAGEKWRIVDPFKEMTSSINAKFNSYSNRQVPNPTKYVYPFRYKSEVTRISLKYQKGGKTPWKIDPATEISESSKLKFESKLFDPKIKKYNLLICNITVNDDIKEEDIMKDDIKKLNNQ